MLMSYSDTLKSMIICFVSFICSISENYYLPALMPKSWIKKVSWLLNFLAKTWYWQRSSLKVHGLFHLFISNHTCKSRHSYILVMETSSDLCFLILLIFNLCFLTVHINFPSLFDGAVINTWPKAKLQSIINGSQGDNSKKDLESETNEKFFLPPFWISFLIYS